MAAVLGDLPLASGERWVGPSVVPGVLGQDRRALGGGRDLVREVCDRCGLTLSGGPLAAGQVRPRGRTGHPAGRHAVARASGPGPNWPRSRRSASTSWSSTSRPTISTCRPSSSSRSALRSFTGHPAAGHPRPAHARVGGPDPDDGVGRRRVGLTAPTGGRPGGTDPAQPSFSPGWLPDGAGAARWSAADAGPEARPAERRWPSATARTALSNGLGGGRRRGLDPTYLAHVLTGGRLDLVGRGRGLEAPQDGDVAAHAPRLGPPTSPTTPGRAVLRSPTLDAR